MMHKLFVIVERTYFHFANWKLDKYLYFISRFPKKQKQKNLIFAFKSKYMPEQNLKLLL